MIRPHPAAFMCGTARRAVWNAAERLSAMIASHFSGGKLSTGATCCIPALLTRISTGPALSISSSTPAADVRSADTWRASSSPHKRSISAGSPNPLSTTSAPSAASARATARPMPEVEPVTSARLPARNICVSMRIASVHELQARLAGPVQPFRAAQPGGGFMRLNPFNPGSINVRRGGGGGGGFPGGGGGQLGCGAIVIALVGALVFGIDPGQMLGSMKGLQQGGQIQQQQPRGSETAAEICD